MNIRTVTVTAHLAMAGMVACLLLVFSMLAAEDYTLDQLPSARNARAQVVQQLIGTKQRTATITAQAQALETKWSLAAVNEDSFGLFEGARGSNMVGIAVGTPNVTCSLPVFTAGDVGKSIDIAGAGPAGAVLRAIITVYVSANAVTIDTNASTGVAPTKTSSAGHAIWGWFPGMSWTTTPLVTGNGAAQLVYPSFNFSGGSFSGIIPVANGGTGQSVAAPFNIKNYGVLGDGITNDAPAIQAAFTAASAGSAFYFPPGVYIVSADISVSKSLYIYGAGRELTKISRTVGGANTEILYITASDVSVRDMTFVGPAAGVYVSEENGIWARGTSGTHLADISILNCEFRDLGSAGVALEYCDGVRVLNNRVHDCGYVGVSLMSCTDGVVSFNDIYTMTPGTAGNAYGAYASQRTDGDDHCARITFHANNVRDIPIWEALDTHGGTDISFVGNSISGCYMGVAVTYAVAPAVTHQPKRISIIGNTITAGGLASPGRAIVVGGADAANRGNTATITGNAIDGMGDTGAVSAAAVTVQYMDGVTVSGNTIRNSTAIALNLYEGVTGMSVTGNTIAGVKTGYGAACGVMLGVGAMDCEGVISGNNIDATAEYGIYFYTEQRNVELRGNRVATTNPLLYVNPQKAGKGLELNGARLAYDFGSISSGAYDWQTISVPGAEIGDVVSVTSSISLANLSCSAFVASAGTVNFTLYNLTGGAIDLGPGDYTATVIKIKR